MKLHAWSVGLDPAIFRFQFIPDKFKIVSEIRAVKKEIRHTFNILFTNKTDGTIRTLEPWYASVKIKTACKPDLHLNKNWCTTGRAQIRHINYQLTQTNVLTGLKNNNV